MDTEEMIKGMKEKIYFKEWRHVKGTYGSRYWRIRLPLIEVVVSYDDLMGTKKYRLHFNDKLVAENTDEKVLIEEAQTLILQKYKDVEAWLKSP